MLRINKVYDNHKAKEFCEEFKKSCRPKYIFGRTSFASSIMKCVDIDGIIDDFTDKKFFEQKPIVPIDKIPSNALVVLSIIGKPLTAEKKVAVFQFDYLDYFSFYKYSNLSIENVMFWDGMKEDIEINFDKYKWIYSIMKDNISKNQLFNILNFRFSYDIDYMRGFSNKEDVQYFEDFQC